MLGPPVTNIHTIPPARRSFRAAALTSDEMATRPLLSRALPIGHLARHLHTAPDGRTCRSDTLFQIVGGARGE
jgi:hypothetical protein